MSNALPVQPFRRSLESLLFTVTPILKVNGSIEGTGFFFSKSGSVDDVHLVTCRHVLLEDNMEFRLHCCNPETGMALSEVATLRIPLCSVVCPFDGTDLAAVRLSDCPLPSPAPNTATGFHSFPVHESLFERYGGFHPTILIGFPHGHFDNLNNLPIWRTGFTASHPLVDYKGKKEGLNNIDCFPADSGAPVFVVVDTSESEMGNFYAGPKTPELLGIHYGGLTSDGSGLNSRKARNKKHNLTSGLAIVEDEQTQELFEPEPVVGLPLGLYIKAEVLNSIDTWGSYDSTQDAYDTYI